MEGDQKGKGKETYLKIYLHKIIYKGIFKAETEKQHYIQGKRHKIIGKIFPFTLQSRYNNEVKERVIPEKQIPREFLMFNLAYRKSWKRLPR